MNFLTTLLASCVLVATVQFVLAFPAQKHFEKVANATCIIQRNEDGLMLEVYEYRTEEPPHGMLQFTTETGNGTEWNLVPVQNSTGLFRLRNIQYNQYLALWPEIKEIITTYYEDYGDFTNFLWKFEETTEGLGNIIHNSTGWCLDVIEIFTPIGPDPIYYIPVMNRACNTTQSSFAITCSDI